MKESILIVDDEEVSRFVLREAIVKRGYVIDQAVDAETGLKKIKQQPFDGYLYYLLSITHRLAGEISKSGFVDGGPSAAEEQFLVSVARAREGQEVDPDHELPITAEASALERLGQLPEAMDARNRAIAMAPAENRRCEGYHYRWRLVYWLGRYDEALMDIDRHAECSPGDLDYAQLYRALVYMEMGQPEEVDEIVEQLTAEPPGGSLAARDLGLFDRQSDVDSGGRLGAHGEGRPERFSGAGHRDARSDLLQSGTE